MTENPCVGGSIPPLATTIHVAICLIHLLLEIFFWSISGRDGFLLEIYDVCIVPLNFASIHPFIIT